MTNLLNTIMETYTIEYWQEHWNELITRVEEGSIIGVTDGKNNAVMVPYDMYLDTINAIEECIPNTTDLTEH